MRKPTQLLAPAFVLGALLCGGYFLAARPTAIPVASAKVAIGTGMEQLQVVTSVPVAELVVTVAPAASPTPASRPTTPAQTTRPPQSAQVQPVKAAVPAETSGQAQASAAKPAAKPVAPAKAPAAAPAAVPSANLQPPDRIVAPSIGLDSKVVTVGWHEVKDSDGSSHTEWDVASYAVGWQKNSALPGQVGNTVLAGHNNIEGEVFRNLGEFQIGDQITLFSGGRTFNYTVAEKFVLQDKGVPYEQRLDNAKWIGPFPDERVTLISCWPPTGNTHRMFIIAHPTKSN
jgi:sortase A